MRSLWLRRLGWGPPKRKPSLRRLRCHSPASAISKPIALGLSASSVAWRASCDIRRQWPASGIRGRRCRSPTPMPPALTARYRLGDAFDPSAGSASYYAQSWQWPTRIAVPLMVTAPMYAPSAGGFDAPADATILAARAPRGAAWSMFRVMGRWAVNGARRWMAGPGGSGDVSSVQVRRLNCG